MAVAPERHDFASRGELAETLARSVAETLVAAISARGTGFIAVSGGTTPAGFFRALSQEEVDWEKVIVTLVDERFVPESSDRSNAALVRANLLQNRAAAARFVGLYHPAATVEQAAAEASEALKALPWPLDVAILGMGLDGHTASFFPDAVTLDELLSAEQAGFVLPVHSLTAGERRLTLPLARIIAAGRVALQIEGSEKRTVLDSALDPEVSRPVSAVFRQRRTPVEIYWAP